MPLDALALALGAAGLHALWNLLLARERDTEAATAVALVALVAVLVLPAALTWRVDADAIQPEHASPDLRQGGLDRRPRRDERFGQRRPLGARRPKLAAIPRAAPARAAPNSGPALSLHENALRFPLLRLRVPASLERVELLRFDERL